MITFPSSCRDMALYLVSQGISVLPLHPHDKKYFDESKREWVLQGKTPCASVLPYVNGIHSWLPFQERLPTQEEVTDWFTRIPALNLAIVTGRLSGLFVIDVDGPEGLKWFKEHIASVQRPFMIQYTRSTERFHAFYRYPDDVEVKTSTKEVHDEIDVRGKGGYVVVYPSRHPETRKQYRLQLLDGFTDLRSQAALPSEVINLLNNPPQKKSGQSQKGSESVESLTFLKTIEEGQRNSSLTSLVGRWLGKGLSKEETRFMALSVNAHFIKPPLAENEVETIVSSISRRDAQAGSGKAERLRSWIMMQEKATFTTGDIFAQLGVQFAAEKYDIVQNLDSLLRQGMIERVGSRGSTYRRVCREVKEIDLRTGGDVREIPLIFPFGLDRSVCFYEKNVIIVSGESNSGKTALLFSLVSLNMSLVKSGKLQRIRYITSEMTADEIRIRISKFNGTPEQWGEVCTFCERADTYADVIDPDGINIIDFLEVSTDFYKVGQDIRQIFDRLNKGIAVIALQKKRGEDFGRGGEFTIEKSRLAISMFTHGRTPHSIFGSAKIIKAKNYRENRNIEGQEIFYELRHGNAFNLKCANLVDPFKRYISASERKKIISKIVNHCTSDKMRLEKTYDFNGEELKKSDRK